jgi:hypothetical protein
MAAGNTARAAEICGIFLLAALLLFAGAALARSGTRPAAVMPQQTAS